MVDSERDGQITLSRREQALEVIVFLLLIMPSVVLSSLALTQSAVPFVLIALSVILRDLGLVGLVLFFLWRNGETSDHVGLTFRKGWRDIGLGIALFIPMSVAANLVESLLQALGLSTAGPGVPSFLAAKGVGEYILAFVMVIVVAFSEEIIFRGYLIHRFANATRNISIALVLSSIIFAVGHGYQGVVGIITVGFIGFIFGLIYLWRKSLVAPITMHFIQDLIGIILIPLIGPK